MFSNEIRMGAFKAVTRFLYREGIELALHFAKTQGRHGSENRTGLIMKELIAYGSAARSVIPGLKEVIVDFNDQAKRGTFPRGELNDRRVKAIEEAIAAIESATSHPELRSLATTGAPGGATK